MEPTGADWRKSSYSSSNGNCIELADVSGLLVVRDGNTTWRKASRSASNGGNCVELAGSPGVVAVRDSKDPDGPLLLLPSATLRAAVLAISETT
ncbi:DUF397 domain-containing protein [Actinomadura sp. 9N407]|uniref:DUF397 domain-containing protein n=1 Tax=Actinomadura sp. 9N407 TaxID=3375154 RepID=UPI0037A5EF9C